MSDERTIDRQVEHGEKWAFNAEVTTVFEDMLKRSIPQYDVMRETVFALGSRFVTPGSDIVDLGCSRGEALQPFVHRFGALNHFVGVEVSPPMLDAARERFANLIARGLVEIRALDLRHTYPPVSASLTLAILTIQFTPIEYRQEIFRRIWEHTRQGGALLLVEKIIGQSSTLDRLFVAEYLAMKKAHGYSDEEIERKRLALEGVLVPVTAAWNEELLRIAGFADVECFWRWANFAGWIAIKR